MGIDRHEKDRRSGAKTTSEVQNMKAGMHRVINYTGRDGSVTEESTQVRVRCLCGAVQQHSLRLARKYFDSQEDFSHVCTQGNT